MVTQHSTGLCRQTAMLQSCVSHWPARCKAAHFYHKIPPWETIWLLVGSPSWCSRPAEHHARYGSPATDGQYQHWDHEVLPHWDAKQRDQFPFGGRFEPPKNVHSPFYPAKVTHRVTAVGISPMRSCQALHAVPVLLHSSRSRANDSSVVAVLCARMYTAEHFNHACMRPAWQGPYSSSDPATIKAHIHEMLDANITGMVSTLTRQPQALEACRHGHVCVCHMYG